MSGNEFSEWPDVHAPSGSHDIGDAKIYDFPLTGDDRVAEKDSHRGSSVDSVGVSMATVKPQGFAYRHRRELVGIAAIAVVAMAVAGFAFGFRQISSTRMSRRSTNGSGRFCVRFPSTC